jgi:hypothetical protein
MLSTRRRATSITQFPPEIQAGGLNPNSKIPRLREKKPLTWLATLATLSPRERAEIPSSLTAFSLGERVARSRRSHQPVRAG